MSEEISQLCRFSRIVVSRTTPAARLTDSSFARATMSLLQGENLHIGNLEFAIVKAFPENICPPAPLPRDRVMKSESTAVLLAALYLIVHQSEPENIGYSAWSV